ncbi:Band 7 stomatin-like domain-containing protein, partial [Reticulomyxa filosa]
RGSEGRVGKYINIDRKSLSFSKKKKGQIGLTQYGDEPQLLGPGRHTLLSPWNEFLAIVNETDQVIRHGPIFIIKVKRGELGYGLDLNDGHPILLSQGRHIIRSNTFLFKGFVTLRDRRTLLDQIEVIRVEMGWIGYCYRAGNLEILEPGLHLITPPDRFGDFLSTQLSILDLPEGVHDTSDYVPLAIKLFIVENAIFKNKNETAVFYRILDARKALLNIQNIQHQITETSVATLAGIIRSSSLSDVASRSQPFYNKKKDGDLKEADAQTAANIQQAGKKKEQKGKHFWRRRGKKAHLDTTDDLLLSCLKQTNSLPCYTIIIESLKIYDDQLQKDISAQAIDVTKQHNRFIMLQKQQAIVTVEAETRATQTRIDTEADAVVIKATAEKEALKLKGLGESDYAKLRPFFVWYFDRVKVKFLLFTDKWNRQIWVDNWQVNFILIYLSVCCDCFVTEPKPFPCECAQQCKGLKQVAYVPHLPGLLSQGRGVFSVGQEMIMPKLDENDA